LSKFQESQKDDNQLNFAMSLSLWFGVLMLVIKTSAYNLTGSSAIMSDAASQSYVWPQWILRLTVSG